MFIKPTAGRLVADPDRGDTLPPEGREVEPIQYWQRRVNDGDVVVVVAEASIDSQEV